MAKENYQNKRNRENIGTKKEIWIASSHFTEKKEKIKEILKYSPDGVVLKSILFRGNPLCNRNCSKCRNNYRSNNRFYFSPLDYTYISYNQNPSCEYLFSEEVRDILLWMKKEYPKVKRIVSIIGKNENEILKIQRDLNNLAQCFEFNSYKYFRKNKININYKEKLIFLEQLLLKMRENTSQPIYIKVSPLDLSKELFKMASKIIEGITICNSYIINKEELSIPIQEELEKTGKDRIAIHGNHLWNYTKQYIPIASNYFKKVSANGGIYNMNRIKKAFELGASSVQLCSALVFNGIDYLNKAIQPEIILASLSPRRKKILKNAGYKFKVISFNINEKKYFQKEIKKTVIKISLEKAKSVAKLIKYPAKIISADTMIDFEGKLIGKPKNKLEAFNLLKLLSGKTHSVYTGYCILNTKTNKIISDYVKTKLTFKKLSRKDIKDYINHYDVLTMAGAYNIESKQSYDLLVKSIEGSYYNVLGFPEEIFKYL